MYNRTSPREQQARIAALREEVEKLQKILGDDENAEKIVKGHHKLLHRYNEAKDAAQFLMGRLAEHRQVTVRQLHEEYGLGPDD